MKKKVIMYHITPRENVKSIIENGLKLNEYGDLFLIRGVNVLADYVNLESEDQQTEWFYEPLDSVVASREVFLEDYALVKVVVKKPKELGIDYSDGPLSAGIGHKFVYHHEIEPEDILDISYRSVRDKSSLILFGEGLDKITLYRNPYMAEMWR